MAPVLPGSSGSADREEGTEGEKRVSRPRVDRREIGFVLIGAGALAALTSIPYLVGLALRDPASRFNGVLVRRFGIRYVFHGGAERTLGTRDPARARWLTEVFRNGAAAIYAVRRR